MTRLEEMNFAALTIQRGWRWTRNRNVLPAASEERLQEVAGGPATPSGVFTSGSRRQEKTESLQEMKSTLKAVEKEWRMLFNEELANLELDSASALEEWSGDPVVVRYAFVYWYGGSACSPELLRCCD